MLALCIGAPCCFFTAAAHAGLLWEEREPAISCISQADRPVLYSPAISVSAYLGMSDRWMPISAS